MLAGCGQLEGDVHMKYEDEVLDVLSKEDDTTRRGNLFKIMGWAWWESHPDNPWGFIRGEYTLSLDLGRLTLWVQIKRLKKL